jgi:hypothetical protein
VILSEISTDEISERCGGQCARTRGRPRHIFFTISSAQ